MRDAGDAHDVGSLGDEAAKLLGALSGWAREHAGEASDGLAGFAAHAAASAHDLNEHLATGSAECTVCPVCRTIHAVRHLSPEVTAHLTTAVTALAQAAAAIMASPVPPESRPHHEPQRDPQSEGGVEHIEVGDEWPEDE